VIRPLALALIFIATPLLPAYGQAKATASRSGDVQFGVGFTAAKPDYGPQSFRGFAAYTDFDFTAHLGLEAEFHQIDSRNGDLAYQQTIDGGLRYFRNYGNFVPYLKAMAGIGIFNYPYGYTRLNYTEYAGGVGADYQIGNRLRLRGEYEIQSWSGFSNDGGLRPQLLTIGIAYHIAGRSR
jgi:hypothetical protein